MKQDLKDPDAILGYRKRVEIMKPKLGGCLLIMDPGEDADTAKPSENIDVIAAGIDPSQLESIIEKLA